MRGSERVGGIAFHLAGVALAIFTLEVGPAAAAQLPGKVTAVTGQDVRIEVEGDLVPQVGDLVQLSFRIPGGPEVSVGRWRVSAVNADGVQATVVQASGTPMVGQTATIDAASPTPRGRIAQARPPGGGSPGSTVPPFDLPGGSAPSPFARRVSIIRSPLIVGPLPIGSGRVEQVGPAYLVVSSDGLATWKPISREPARDLYATIRARVQRGSSDPAVVGLLLSLKDNEFQDGDVFFGKVENQGLTVQRWEGGRWTSVTGVQYVGRPVAPQEIDRFEITRHRGTYQLRANGLPIVTFEDPGAQPKWVQVFTGPGNQAEFFDWGVERPE